MNGPVYIIAKNAALGMFWLNSLRTGTVVNASEWRHLCGVSDPFVFPVGPEWWKNKNVRHAKLTPGLNYVMIDRVNTFFPVVIHDDVTQAIAEGNFEKLPEFLSNPAYLKSEFVAAWIVFDILGIPEDTLDLLLGLVSTDYLTAYIEKQKDFHVRLLVATVDRHRPEILRRLFARGVRITQEHLDAAATYMRGKSSFSTDQVRQSLRDLFPRLNFSKFDKKCR